MKYYGSPRRGRSFRSRSATVTTASESEVDFIRLEAWLVENLRNWVVVQNLRNCMHMVALNK